MMHNQCPREDSNLRPRRYNTAGSIGKSRPHSDLTQDTAGAKGPQGTRKAPRNCNQAATSLPCCGAFCRDVCECLRGQS